MKLHWAALFCTAMAIGGGAVQAAEVAPGDVTFEDGMVTEPLTDQPGDPAAGAKAFADRGLGNCLACHQNPDMAKQLFHGNVGPSLEGVADRWEPAQLRAIVVNAKKVFGEETVMPGFYTLEVGTHLPEDLKGTTILSAQQVEDVVAYLATLKE